MQGVFFEISKKINILPNSYFLGLFFQTCNGLGITFKSLIFFSKKYVFWAIRGSFFEKSQKINYFPNYYFLGLFFQTSDGLGITFKDLILFFKKKSFWAHRGSFLKNQKISKKTPYMPKNVFFPNFLPKILKNRGHW